MDRDELDLRDDNALQGCILRVAPDVVINAAAYTAVDRAESEPKTAELINAQAPIVMARITKQIDALLVHYSTDYVFDGTAQRPYTETDTPSPINVYGRTKREGEVGIETVGGRYLILRTSWVFSRIGKNFLNTVLRLTDERPSLSIVDDQFGSPTYADDVAAATLEVIAAVAQSNRDLSGVYHMTAAGSTSWCGFAREIVTQAGGVGASIRGITSIEYPTPAARPRYSVLSNDRLSAAFGISLPPWQDGLARCLADGDPVT